MINKLSLKVKLLFLCAALSGVSVVVGMIGHYTLGEVTNQFSFLAEKVFPKTRVATELYSEVRNYRLYLRTLATTEMAASEKVLAKIAKIEEGYAKLDKTYTDFGFIPGQKELYEKSAAQWLKIQDYGHKLVELYKAEKKDELAAHLKSEDALADTYRDAIDELLAFHKKIGESKVAGATLSASNGNKISYLTIICGAIFGMVSGFLFSTSIAKTLTHLAGGLFSGAENVATASEQISSASTQLSAAATEQAASLQETVAAVDEISSMIAKNAENANNSQAVAAKSRDAATNGKEVVEQMIQSMNEINVSTDEIKTQTENSNKEFAEVINVINEIGNKTKIINDIVFQTKLLSFNASVEAARAGENGKGFAVVAEEVGKLAQMSGNAAKEISDLLSGSVQKVETIVNNSKTQVEQLVSVSKTKVDSGLETALRCGGVLDEIVLNVSGLFNHVNEIAEASKEQSSGVQEISRAMAQLDQVTQQNTAASNQASSAGAQLTEQAQELHEMVRTLVKTVEGENAANSGDHSVHAKNVRTLKKPKAVSSNNDYSHTTKAG